MLATSWLEYMPGDEDHAQLIQALAREFGWPSDGSLVLALLSNSHYGNSDTIEAVLTPKRRAAWEHLDIR
jgi:hypothetical protein